MTSETPREGRCAAECRDGDYCESYPVQGADRCRMHGGTNDGAPERNQNATRHGLQATPEYLVEHLDEHHKDQLVATFESLCTRYESVHARDPDFAAQKRLRRIAIEIVKEDLADEWLAQQAAESGHLLMEHREVVDDETGDVVREYDVPNSVLEPLTALKRETRLTLKDMGLLRDPKTKHAEATAEGAAAIRQFMTEADEQDRV